MTRSSANRMSLPAAILWLACGALFGCGLSVPAAGQLVARVGFPAEMYAQGNTRGLAERPAPNAHAGPGAERKTPNGMNRPGALTPHRADAQQHLGEWMDAHRSLSAAQQQSALDAEPGFLQLKPEEQQRMHNLVTRLNSMSPEQRQRTTARTEWMERLAPQQRQQVRSAMAQLGSLPQDRSYAVGRAFRSLQAMPAAERQAYLNSAQFRGQFSEQEQGTLSNLLNVSPLLPPPSLGAAH